MPSKFKFQELINQPLGPYPDHLILSPSFPTQGVVPTLDLLTLECNREPIGFDECEFIHAPSETSRIALYPIFFYGQLVIESLDWLSEGGKQRLEAELRARDEKLHRRELTRRSSWTSGLTLESLYGDARDRGSTIKVFLHGEKALSAEYMTSSKHKASFLIHSKTRDEKGKNRLYKVVGLETDTFQRSQNFLMRFRIWALIDKLLELDDGRTPIQDRTVKWIVDRYADAKQLGLAEFQSSALSFVDDNQGSSGSDEDAMVVDEEDGSGDYRHHISHHEIQSFLASQSEWLLAFQLAPSQRHLWKVNLLTWASFCERVQVMRKDSLRRGGRWGMPYMMNRVSDAPLAARLSQFGESVAFWENKLKNLKRNWEEFVKRQQAAREQSVEIEVGPGNSFATSSRPPPPRLSEEIEPFRYDEDFSEPSTPGEIDSDADIPRASPSAIAKIPYFCHYPPKVYPGRFKWDCPGCDYTLDLLALKKEELDLLARREADYIASLKWDKVTDDRVRDAFGIMANKHLLWHMNQVGADILMRKGEVLLVPYDGPNKKDERS